MKAGDAIETKRADWSFGGNVAENFISHVSRSVPGYEEGHNIVCRLSDFFCLKDSIAYEIGTSTGELLRKLAKYNEHKPDIRWIGVDTEEPMIQKAAEHCKGVSNIELHQDDVRLFPYEKSDFIVSYYVIQFIPPRDRQKLIDKIYETLNWGGAFVWFEKVRGPDARFQDIMVNMYHNFKLDNGYDAEEIMNKSNSLKGVMEPFSSDGNLGLLERAGFKDVMPIYRNMCFEGLVCIK